LFIFLAEAAQYESSYRRTAHHTRNHIDAFTDSLLLLLLRLLFKFKYIASLAVISSQAGYL